MGKVMEKSLISDLYVSLDWFVLVPWFCTFLPYIHVFYALTPEGGLCGNQLSEDGKNEHDQLYKQKLTMGVGDKDGRYAYIAWALPSNCTCQLTIPGRYRLVKLTGETFQTMAEAAGMSSIYMQANEYAYSRAHWVMEDAKVRWEREDREDKKDVNADIKSFQTVSKHLSSTLPRLNHRILLDGLLVGGLQFQIQVTVFGLTLASLKEKTSIMYDVQASIAIIAAFLKVLLTLPSICNFFTNIHQHEKALNKMLDRHNTDDRQKTGSDEAANEEESIRSLLRELSSFRVRARAFGAFFLVVLYILIWGFLKCHALDVCPQHIWNWKSAALTDFMAGCVNASCPHTH